jgi:hypothetical protein
MMRTLGRYAFALAVVVGLGCAPAPLSPSDGSAPDGSSSDGGGTVTYTKDIRPIFMVKCATCHTTDGLGGHNIGTTYADALKPVTSLDAPAGCYLDGFARTMPKTIGECTLPAIMEGWMPMAMGCFNTPRPAPCVTTAEQDLVAAWVAAGTPQ